MKTIRWGIVGTGWISSMFATALNSIENTEIVAVASRNQNKAEEFAKSYSIRKAYSSYEDLAKDPEVDVVYIGTPHTEHKNNTSIFLKNGMPVLCEKPFTLNLKDSQYLVSLARENDVFLMEAMWTKFLPATNKVKEWIKNDLIGKVKFIKVSFGGTREFNPEDRFFSPKLAGGALLDVGIYPITYAIHLMESLPDQVFSMAHMGTSNVDEVNAMMFHFKKAGVIADLSSALNADIGRDAVIIGEKGKIVVPNFWMADSAKCFDLEDNLLEEFSTTYDANGYIFEAMEVNQCLREGKKESDLVPLQDTLDIMKLMDDMRKEWGLVYPQEIE
jgi:Predicted dehydrogenases and related proteins